MEIVYVSQAFAVEAAEEIRNKESRVASGIAEDGSRSPMTGVALGMKVEEEMSSLLSAVSRVAAAG